MLSSRQLKHVILSTACRSALDCIMYIQSTAQSVSSKTNCKSMRVAEKGQQVNTAASLTPNSARIIIDDVAGVIGPITPATSAIIQVWFPIWRHTFKMTSCHTEKWCHRASDTQRLPGAYAAVSASFWLRTFFLEAAICRILLSEFSRCPCTKLGVKNILAELFGQCVTIISRQGILREWWGKYMASICVLNWN